MPLMSCTNGEKHNNIQLLLLNFMARKFIYISIRVEKLIATRESKKNLKAMYLLKHANAKF